MSSLTRCRCETDGVPTKLVEQYYGQRTGSGIILSECVSISQRGNGYVGQANLYNKEQAEGWRKVIETVHKKDTKIFA